MHRATIPNSSHVESWPSVPSETKRHEIHEIQPSGNSCGPCSIVPAIPKLEVVGAQRNLLGCRWWASLPFGLLCGSALNSCQLEALGDATCKPRTNINLELRPSTLPVATTSITPENPRLNSDLGCRAFYDYTLLPSPWESTTPARPR